MKELPFKINSLAFSYIILIIGIILILFKVGSDVARNDYNFIALLFIILLVFTVFHSTKFALIVLLFLGFVGHQIIQFGAPPELIYFWDLIIILLLSLSENDWNKKI